LFYYTGQEWDKDAKLQNSNARWYDPRMGRFLGEDPTGFDAGDPNFYRYAGNDPVNYTDPTGLSQAGNPLSSLFSGVTKAVTSTANKIAGAVQSIGNSVNSIYNSSQYYAAVNQTKGAVGGFQVAGFDPSLHSYVQNSSRNTGGLFNGISMSGSRGESYAPSAPGRIASSMASSFVGGLSSLTAPQGFPGETPRTLVFDDGRDFTDRQVASVKKIESTVWGDPLRKTANEFYRDIKSDNPFVATYALAGYAIDSLAANLLDAIKPPTGPTIITTYADRGQKWDLAPLPRSGAMWGQGLMVAAPLARTLGVAGATVVEGGTFIGPTIGRSGYRTMAEFDAAVGAKYQQFVNQGYAGTMDLVRQGVVRNNPTAIGREVDTFARTSLRDWLRNTEGIPEGPGQII